MNGLFKHTNGKIYGVRQISNGYVTITDLSGIERDSFNTPERFELHVAKGAYTNLYMESLKIPGVTKYYQKDGHRYLVVKNDEDGIDLQHYQGTEVIHLTHVEWPSSGYILSSEQFSFV